MQASPQMSTETLGLREYLAVIRMRKWTILLISLLVVGSALFFSYRQTPLYVGSVRMLVRGVPADSSGYVPPPNLLTEAEIVASEPVATRVAAALDLASDPQSLLSELDVEPAADTAQVLRLSYTSPDPQAARDVPNSFATEYVEYKRE